MREAGRGELRTEASGSKALTCRGEQRKEQWRGQRGQEEVACDARNGSLLLSDGNGSVGSKPLADIGRKRESCWGVTP